MSTFLDRLKKKEIIPSTPGDEKQEKIDAQNKPAAPVSNDPPAEQLKVDIFQSEDGIIIYAQLAGSNVNDFGVTIEGDGDVVTIKGERKRPNGDLFPNIGLEKAEHVLEECSWGKFYRQIILPAEVDASKTEAKMREGVLVLLLPLKHGGEKGVRINVTSL